MIQINQYIRVKGGPKYTGHATVCVTCFKKITEFKLQKCSGCRLVFYCSKEHQKLHWPKHKELCKPVQSMIKKNGNRGLFDDYVGESFDMWLDVRMSWLYICERIIGRILSNEESALFVNPFSCKICHAYKPNSMITCKDCCVISYCSEEHQLKDKLSHSLVCSELKFCLDFDIKFIEPFILSICISDVSTLPSDIKAFIDGCVTAKTDRHINDLFVTSYLSDTLTLPLTLIYVIEKTNIDLTKESLRVHIVGSGQFESLAWWCWEYIFHYFKKLRIINFCFVGPETLNGFTRPTVSCQNCINFCSLNSVFDNGLYHDYIKQVTEPPDIIMVYNCDFHTHDSWKMSMPALCGYPGTAVAFTSHRQDDSKLNLKMLKKFCKNDNIKVLVNSQENPFKGLIPFHDWYRENRNVYYKNNFISILTT